MQRRRSSFRTVLVLVLSSHSVATTPTGITACCEFWLLIFSPIWRSRLTIIRAEWPASLRHCFSLAWPPIPLVIISWHFAVNSSDPIQCNMIAVIERLWVTRTLSIEMDLSWKLSLAIQIIKTLNKKHEKGRGIYLCCPWQCLFIECKYKPCTCIRTSPKTLHLDAFCNRRIVL